MYLNIRWIHFNLLGVILWTLLPSPLVTVLLISTLIQSSAGVHQWLLLVLFWERCYRWARPAEFFQGNKCGQAGFQYTHWVHPGRKTTSDHLLLLKLGRSSCVNSRTRGPHVCCPCLCVLTIYMLMVHIFNIIKSFFGSLPSTVKL